MDADKPCRCPRCGWLGTIHDAEAYQPLAHLEPLNMGSSQNSDNKAR